ncbi:MAG: hypothetical protein QOI13_2531 [Paraburkholderia sp.]|nr:hypothetical protein [Paraburkholderia sp.]
MLMVPRVLEHLIVGTTYFKIIRHMTYLQKKIENDCACGMRAEWTRAARLYQDSAGA